jgi:rhamnosyltransferase
MPVLVAISVVIRTKDSSRTLPQVLQRLGRSGPDEIIIVDSGSTDSTLAIAKQHEAKIIVTEGPFNYSRSLNCGFEAATNPWVLALSSHCIPLSLHFLADWRAALTGLPSTVAVGYGPCLLAAKPASSAQPQPISLVDELTLLREKQAPAGNVNALYRRECWQRQKFDEACVGGGEDLVWLLWALRSGYVAARVPQAAVLYRNQGGLRHMFSKGFNESIVAQQLLRSKKASLRRLCVGVGSLAKKLLLNRIPLNIFLNQSAHQLGDYLGSRRVRPKTAMKRCET